MGGAQAPRVVLVPGGFTGAWMWADVAALLERAGIAALAVELPTIGEDSAGADFYADAHAVRSVLDRLRPANLTGADQPVGVAAWTHLPSIYVRGSQDRMPEAVAAGFLDHADQVIELPTGHCPNWSRPDLVADLLADRVRSLARASP